MHRFNGYDIELTQGDSLFFKVNLDGRTLPEGSVGYFTVKKTPKSDEIIIQKKLDASDGVLDIRLTSEDTYIPVRTYYWDVRVLIPLEEGGYEVETPMEYASFTILDAIGYPGDAEQPPGMDADLPVLSMLISETKDLLKNVQTALESGDFIGPKGDSGVYVGSEEPTDESVNVWIDPKGEAQSITGMLGYTPANAETVSELSAEIAGKIVVRSEPPEDTSVLWVDPSDDSGDDFQEVVDAVIAALPVYNGEVV